MSLRPVTRLISRRVYETHGMPINAERIRKLGEFGLTEYQARVYLTLLDLGTATAAQIPPFSRVPRTRIYATMAQLHDKGLVEILPETPLKYKPVRFEDFVAHAAQEWRERAERLESSLQSLAREFAVTAKDEPAERGHFEAIYGRRNVRERLLRMYGSAKSDAIGIGTSRSPGRIMKAFGSVLIERANAGVAARYAFPVREDNLVDFEELRKYAKVRNIDFRMPVYMHVVDGREFLMSHPIPDDDSFYRGDDIAIWTDDSAIAEALYRMAQRIWETGTEPPSST